METTLEHDYAFSGEVKQKQENGYLPLASKQETNTVLEHTVDRVDQLPHQLNHSFPQCPVNEQFGEPSIQIYSEQTVKNEHTVHVVEQYEQSLGNEHAIEGNEQFVEMVDVDSVGLGEDIEVVIQSDQPREEQGTMDGYENINEIVEKNASNICSLESQLNELTGVQPPGPPDETTISKTIESVHQIIEQSSKFDIFSSLTEGFALLDSGEGSPQVCIRYTVESSDVNLKVYLATMVHLETSRVPLVHLKHQLSRLEGLRVCEGVEEEVILPLIQSNKHLSLLVIDAICGKFRYRTRQCEKIAATGRICAQCRAIFFEVFSITEVETDKSGNLIEISKPQQFKQKQQQHRQHYQQQRDHNHLGQQLDPPPQQQQSDPIDRKITTKFPCDHCYKQFNTEAQLNKHIKVFERLEKKVEIKQCLYCVEQFQMVGGGLNKDFVKHLILLHGDKAQESSFREIMERHQKLILQCDYCSESFNDEKSKEIHLRLAHPEAESENVFCCHVCGKVYERYSTLFGHMKIHRPGNYICTECGAAFKVRSYLNRHMNSHDKNKKKFPCDECDKKFCRPYLMEQHKKFTHNKDLPFKCVECGKAARTLTRLNIHIRAVHSKEKPFPCEVCGFKSSRMDNLNMHRTKVHPHLVRSNLTRVQLVDLIASGQHKFCNDHKLIPNF